METTNSNFTVSLVFVVLYILALLTVARLFLNSDYELPEKLQWMNKILDVPYVGPVAYWLYFALTGRKKEKHNTPPK